MVNNMASISRMLDCEGRLKIYQTDRGTLNLTAESVFFKEILV